MHSQHRPTAARPFRRSFALAAAVAALVLADCSGVENLSGTAGTTRNGTGGVIAGGGSAQSAALVGQWTRAILVATPNGDLHQSRTTWEFRADQSAIRQVTAWNLSSGIYDTISSVAQWSTNGSSLTIVYIAGSTGTLTLPWSVSGDILTIGPDQFARVR